MATPLKDLYSPDFFDSFADILKEFIQPFDKKKFVQSIFCEDWFEKELKERQKHTTSVLHTYLPQNFDQACKIILDLSAKLKSKPFDFQGIEFLFLPEWIEKNGLLFPEKSIKIFEELTTFVTCEFAVRPFIANYPNQMVTSMTQWSKHKNEHVRRLASEGCRPRLPWGMALTLFKTDPKPILPILENLKNDPSEYVRRSVANNLNDIAKDHPEITLKIAKNWFGKTKYTDTLLKHACRTLLKKGDARALKLFGLSSTINTKVSDFKILTPEVGIGNNLHFEFSLTNLEKEKQLIRVEYAIYYLLKSGEYGKKIFKISEKNYLPNQFVTITKKHSFRAITTRVFYSGIQKLSILVNGCEKGVLSFELN
ncbi:MAG: DNA alkylation repair protein [Flavobacteriales bacterium]|nr:DNA alkylation repair protein [Flavobacteriales bacterium]